MLTPGQRTKFTQPTDAIVVVRSSRAAQNPYHEPGGSPAGGQFAHGPSGDVPDAGRARTPEFDRFVVEHTVDKGVDGFEHAVMINHAPQTTENDDQNGVKIPPYWFNGYYGSNLSLFHNHPTLPISLSSADVKMLGYHTHQGVPAIGQVVALSQLGDRFEARRGPEWENAPVRTTYDVEHAARSVVNADLDTEYRPHDPAWVHSALVAQHAQNLILAKTGIIHYRYTLTSPQAKAADIDAHRVVPTIIARLRLQHHYPGQDPERLLEAPPTTADVAVYGAYDLPYGQPRTVWEAELAKITAHLVQAPHDLVAREAERGLREAIASMRTLGGEGSGNFGHAGRPGEVGGSGPSGGGEHASGILEAIHQADGGFTYSPLTGASPTTGFAVSLHKDKELVLQAKDVTVDKLAAYTVQHYDLLSQSGNYLGGWHNPKDGLAYIDVSTVVDTGAEAERLGREAHQLAYFDLVQGKSIPIDYPEVPHVKAATQSDWPVGWATLAGRPDRPRAAIDGPGSDADRAGRRQAPAQPDPFRTARSRETLVHAAADRHLPALTVAVRYAFARARHLAKQDPSKVEAILAMQRQALAEVLAPTLAKIVADGGQAGIQLLNEPTVLGGVGSGNFGHAGRPGEVGGSGQSTRQREVTKREVVAKQIRRIVDQGEYAHYGVRVDNNPSLMVGHPAPVSYDWTDENRVVPLKGTAAVEIHDWTRVIEYSGRDIILLGSDTAVKGTDKSEIVMPDAVVLGKWTMGEGFWAGRNPKMLGGVGSGNFGHAGRPGEVGGSATGDGGVPSNGRVTRAGLDQRFPIAGETVDGLTIPDFHDEAGPDIPNMSSISASLTDYEILDGVREVKISEFEDDGKPSFYSSTEEAKVNALAKKIRTSKEITPLIVVVDKDGQRGPYVLEGGHRFDALKINGARSFPALVVVDTEKLKLLAGFRAAKRGPGKFTLKFDVANPYVVKWADQHAAELITDISEQTREDINNAIADAVEHGTFEDAYDEILAAVGDSKRADLIARTEIMKAASEGQRLAWASAVDEGLLTGDESRTWIAVGDEKVCPICDALDGETVGMTESYSDGSDGPPAHPRCRCTEGLTGD